MMKMIDLSAQSGLSPPFHNPKVRAVKSAGSATFLPEVHPGLYKKLHLPSVGVPA